MEYILRTWREEGNTGEYVGYGPSYLSKVGEDGYKLIAAINVPGGIQYIFCKE